MAVGHPDYWRRMVSRISIEGYAPEYYFFDTSHQLAGLEIKTFLDYPIPLNYLFNLTGIIVSCSMPGTNRFSVGKLGGDFLQFHFDTVFAHEMQRGMFVTLQYGDTLRISLISEIGETAIFRLNIQALLEFEG